MQPRAFPPAILMAAAIAVGASMDALIKLLAQSNAVLLVILGRYVFGALFSWAIWMHAGRPRISAEMWRAHAFRGVFIALSGGSYFWALTVLPLAEAVTLTFIYPLMIPFIAHVVLREQVRPSSLVAAAIGFVGIIIAAQGGPSIQAAPLHALGVAAVLFSAMLYAVAMVLMRVRAQSDGAPIVGLMASLIPALLVAPLAITVSPPPHWADWPLFLLMGVTGAVFMYLLARAYAAAEAQQLAPLHYTELIWASLFGFVLFHEAPRLQVYAGASLIIVACLFSASDGRALKPESAA